MFLELNTRHHPDLVSRLHNTCTRLQSTVYIEYPPLGIKMWMFKNSQLEDLIADLLEQADAYARSMCGSVHQQLEEINVQILGLGSVLFVKDYEGHAWLFGGMLQNQLNSIVWLPAESEGASYQLRDCFVAEGEVLRG